MTSGLTPKQADMWLGSAQVVEGRVAADSIWAVLHPRVVIGCSPMRCSRICSRDRGRRSVPPSIVATVMVLQRLVRLSDREAVEASSSMPAGSTRAGGFGLRPIRGSRTRCWSTCGPGWRVGATEADLRGDLDAAHGAGWSGHRRVLDSTPLYDAVATKDTVTMIRSAIRGLLTVADRELAAELRARVGAR